MTRCLCGLATKHHFDAANRKLTCERARALHPRAKAAKRSFRSLLADERKEGSVKKKITTPNIATLVKRIEGWVGDASLYKLSVPVMFDEDSTTNYVIVSAVSVPFSGPETYIFPADKNGEVLDWGELDGSYRGGFSHERALRGAGYEAQL